MQPVSPQQPPSEPQDSKEPALLRMPMTGMANLVTLVTSGLTFAGVKHGAMSRLKETPSGWAMAKHDGFLQGVKEGMASLIDPRRWKSTGLAFGAGLFANIALSSLFVREHAVGYVEGRQEGIEAFGNALAAQAQQRMQAEPQTPNVAFQPETQGTKVSEVQHESTLQSEKPKGKQVA